MEKRRINLEIWDWNSWWIYPWRLISESLKNWKDFPYILFTRWNPRLVDKSEYMEFYGLPNYAWENTATFLEFYEETRAYILTLLNEFESDSSAINEVIRSLEARYNHWFKLMALNYDIEEFWLIKWFTWDEMKAAKLYLEEKNNKWYKVRENWLLDYEFYDYLIHEVRENELLGRIFSMWKVG